MEQRQSISLSGLWDFSLLGADFPQEKRQVPWSYTCVGGGQYWRTFSAPQTTGRVLLCFEGIAYEGRAILNGTELPRMEPYVDYRFDITHLLLPENTLTVEILDRWAVFGPVDGWCNYSGIIREISLLTVPDSYLEDVFFHTQLHDNFAAATCTAEITLAGTPAQLPVEVCLSRNGLEISRVLATVSQTGSLTWEVDHPELWSPDSPALYQLSVTAGADSVTMQVGFKDFCAKGNRFYLNGQPIFLAGVCRHDLWTDREGHTLTLEQIQRDLRMIKDTGMNYARLVHYPHDRRVLDEADRIGLLVSCEPGFWWSDLENQELVDRGMQVMEKLIIRDRSRVSVAFWLTFNECVLNEAFVKKSAETVRRTDPTRMVSGANCMDKVSTKRFFDGYYDFYTYHPYGYAPEMVTGGVSEGNQWITGWQNMEELCRYMGDKPLLFTEWGGYYVHDNPKLFRDFCRTMLKLADGKDGAVLAGASYWVWADYYEYNRDYPSSVCGATIEGLNDMERNPRVNLDVLRRELSNWRCPAQPEPSAVCPYAFGDLGEHYEAITLPSTKGDVLQTQVWDDEIKRFLEHRIPNCNRPRRMAHGPVLPHAIHNLGLLPVKLPAEHPHCINQQTGELIFAVAQAGQALYLFGNACFNYAFPVDRDCRPVAECRCIYSDGTEEVFPLRNGVELATVHRLYAGTRLDPRGANLQPAVDFSYDPSWEQYRLYRLTLPLQQDKCLEKLAIRTLDEQYTLLLYGLTVKK